MRIAIFSLGSRGDAQPFAALGLALQARGHAVTLCLPENFKALAEGLGLACVPVAWDTQAALQDAGLRQRLQAGDVLGFFRRVSGQAWERRDGIFKALIDAAQTADLLIGASTTEDAVALLGQALHKPVIQAELAPFSPSSAYAPIGLSQRSWGPLNRPLHALSRYAWWRLNRRLAQGLAEALGLPAPGRSPALQALKRGAPVLHGFSAQFFEAPRDWVPGRHFVGGAWALGEDAQRLAGEHQDQGFAQWLEDGPAPVYLSFGSMPALDGEALLELAGDVAEALGLRVVLGTGWTEIDSAACDLPEGVALAGDCDHAWLFARCSAVIHHAGAGSTHAASLAGLPQVACPLFADQPFWAERLRRSGAGLVLPYRRLSAESLAQALGEAMQDEVQEAAARLGQAMQSEGGAQAAAEQVERWAGL
jgi:sterol 3beta-glucosyltransferase